MNASDLKAICLAQPESYEDFPFGEEVAVYKVRGKIFALLSPETTEKPPRISLKCDPVEAVLLRETYPAVQPGYHLNKMHWNTVTVDGSISNAEIIAMIEDSYILVVKTLKKADREALLDLRTADADDTNQNHT